MCFSKKSFHPCSQTSPDMKDTKTVLHCIRSLASLSSPSQDPPLFEDFFFCYTWVFPLGLLWLYGLVLGLQLASSSRIGHLSPSSGIVLHLQINLFVQSVILNAELRRHPSSVWEFWKHSRNKCLLHLSKCAMNYAIKSSNLVFRPRLILMKFHYVQLFGITEILPFGSAIKCHLRTWIEIEFLVHLVILLIFWSKFTFF